MKQEANSSNKEYYLHVCCFYPDTNFGLSQKDVIVEFRLKTDKIGNYSQEGN